jgi:cytochrome c peroxidase
MVHRRVLLIVIGIAALLLVPIGATWAAGTLSPGEQLGKAIFFDTNLSLNGNQSCASCHDPAVGFTGPLSATNAHGAVYEGSIAGAFGDRKPPSSAYTTMSPILHQDRTGTWIGGNFWDGRATGARLGNPAADQAQGPFLNPAEQALADSACVVHRVCTASYPVSFESVWGADACDITWPADAGVVCTAGRTLALSDDDRARSNMDYDRIALSIASFEASAESNAYTSKFDATYGGKVKLTKEEQRGLALFKGKGGCSACHPVGKAAVFTDFTFDNLGIPVNPENPAVIRDPGFRDPGLGGFLRAAGYDEDTWSAELGKHKVPTLRNADLRPDLAFVKAFGHNGYFKSLEGIVHFYNTRDVLPECPGAYTEAQALAAGCWPAPEIADNVNDAELGDLGLSASEEAAIVAFLRTLSDGYGQ